MSLSTIQKIDRMSTDADVLHQIVHGPAAGDGSTVQTDGGPVPTAASAIARVQTQSDLSIASVQTTSNEAINSITAAVAAAGYQVPVAYAAGISIDNASQTVSWQGQVYAPQLAAIPFETGDVFDATKFRLIQGVAGTDLASRAGPAMVGYLHPVPDSELVTLDVALRSTVYLSKLGAVADDATDVLPHLTNALAAGYDVVVDGTYYLSAGVTLGANHQCISAINGGQLRVANGVATALSATGLVGVSVRDVRIVAGSTYQSTAVSFTNVLGGRIEGVKISQHGTGISLSGCAKTVIAGNDFTAASNNASYGMSSSSDIHAFAGCDGLVIANNTCRSAGAYGIQLRTDGTETVTNCIVSGNVVDGYNSYGIMLYRHDITGPIVGCVISGNTVSNISGARPNTAGGSDYIFGAGIYLQGAEYFVCSNNNLTACNTATTNELLAPAAIGTASAGVGIISDNMIRDTAWYGLYINDTGGVGASNGSLLVRGNNIATCGKDGLKAVAKVNLAVHENSIFGATGNGMTFSWGATTIALDKLTVSGNMVKSAGVTGISINNATNATITGNNVSACAGDGIFLGHTNHAIICDNTSAQDSARGINIDATNTGDILFDGNNLDGDAIGATFSVPVRFGQNGNSSATPWGGPYAPFQTLPDGNATPAVGGLNWVASQPSAALIITNLLGGFTGDRLTIQATNSNTTVQNNANLLLQGSTNFVMTNNSTLTLLKTAGVWVETSRSAH